MPSFFIHDRCLRTLLCYQIPQQNQFPRLHRQGGSMWRAWNSQILLHLQDWTQSALDLCYTFVPHELILRLGRGQALHCLLRSVNLLLTTARIRYARVIPSTLLIRYAGVAHAPNHPQVLRHCCSTSGGEGRSQQHCQQLTGRIVDAIGCQFKVFRHAPK